MSRKLTYYLVAIILSLPLTAQALEQPYLQELVAQAQRGNLAQHPQWRTLLHYEPNLFTPGYTSLADDPDFFNAQDGKTSPEAELAATLEKFFDEGQYSDQQQHPQCRFIARYHWLNEQLGFDSTRLPQQSCPRFQEWLTALNPQGLTLIFPTAYLNNPSSMFGHTLLRVDAWGQNEKTRLLAYTVNYAANTGADGGIPFAIKGIFGGYPGGFSIAPYYLKVREYSDIENRDVWEYQLDLTTEEVTRMLRHLWELRTIYFDYFFFDENCSYYLLALLEAARPGLDLTSSFRAWAIPPDTVRAIINQVGLVRAVKYRPSRRTILEYRLARLDEELQALAVQLGRGNIEHHNAALQTLPPQHQAELFELGYEFLSYRRAKDKDDNDETGNLMQELLLARSKLEAEPTAIEIEPPKIRPDQGHDTARLAVKLGQSDQRWFQEIQLRPAYHDLLDPEEGYTSGAQINFLDISLRHYTDDEFRLEQFNVVDIVSLTPISPITKPISWKINGGLTRLHQANGIQPLAFRLNGGGGTTWSAGHNTMLYSMIESTLDASKKLEEDYALGMGLSAGALSNITAGVKISLSGALMRFGLGQRHTLQELNLALRYSLSHSSNLRLDLARKREFGYYWSHASLAWQVYF